MMHQHVNASPHAYRSTNARPCRTITREEITDLTIDLHVLSSTAFFDKYCRMHAPCVQRAHRKPPCRD
jgi:hypothetical protein